MGETGTPWSHGSHIGEQGGEEISNAKEEKESQRRAPRKAHEDFPEAHVYSGSCGRALSKMKL